MSYYVLGNVRFSDVTVEDVRKWLTKHISEKELAEAYVVSDKKWVFVKDTICDYEEGSKEYNEACQLIDEWCALEKELRGKILEILKYEGVNIPQTGQVLVMIPFMKRNGYLFSDGWWIKEE